MIRRPLKKNFTSVLLLDTKTPAKVVDHLSAQFTVETGDGRIHYFFYADEGDTWKRVGFCHCANGSGGKPCISRAYCDENRTKKWNEANPKHQIEET